ncbi:MAG: SIMPL domain-containing protein [Marinobacter sp.]|uniref:SIMPL domain-containing protein n=1 Tax=Marinobacter sp. TaxID=50741 RepID=UPI001B48A3E0|nr:SIMPL domain-containing protein [Marinobacter sp.]MBQ0746342.1 SIMPL domain-containing protein [Marinobacter sp.]MBQ0814834.1 SIMPL domain-containing protein [Marinobacter sp.]|tara:strand:- start:1469 stop:2155 length:687 start_codon:yes stop_codon:yes gene_type:complete
MVRKNRKTHALWALPLLVPGLAMAGEVTLTGEGSVHYEPDSARLTFTASAEHELPSKATEQVASMMAQWREGISEYRSQLQDYADASVNLYKRTLPMKTREEVPENRAVASQTVSFTITDLALLNPILQHAQALGLNYNLGPNQFFHSQETRMEREALALALADAKSRCEFVAQQMNQSCGDVVTLNINGGHRPMPMMMSAEARSADTISSVGEREISASVNATFELD